MRVENVSTSRKVSRVSRNLEKDFQPSPCHETVIAAYRLPGTVTKSCIIKKLNSRRVDIYRDSGNAWKVFEFPRKLYEFVKKFKNI